MLQTVAWGQSFSAFNDQPRTVPPEGVIRYGSIEATWVRSPIDGETLFQVAAPTVNDRSNLQPEDLPVEVRAQSVEALLRIEVDRFHRNVLNRLIRQLRLWDTRWSAPRSAEVITSTLNNRLVIQIKSSDRSRPLTIITITQTDIDFYSENPEVLSEEWRAILQDEIDKLEQLSSLRVVRRGLWQSLAIVLGLMTTLLILSLLYWLVSRQYRVLKNRSESEAETADSPSSSMPTNAVSSSSNGNELPADSTAPADAVSASESRVQNNLSGLLAERSRFLELLKKPPPLERQLNVLKFLQWLLVWLTILLTYGSLIGLTYTLPLVTSWRTTLLREPFRLLIIWFITGLVLRLTRALAHRRQAGHNVAAPQSSEAQRKLLRVNTVGGALEGFVSVLIVLTGLALTFSAFGLSPQSVLAWGAVLGLAISFGTQSLIKDVVNGCLILLEDQFAVGDVIAIGSMFGLVEEMNLRSTRLRDPEGQLITIPNGNIAEVRNLTRLWSRVDFTVEVAYDNDPDKVLKLLNDIAQDMYALPEWHEKMPAPPEVLGIDQLSHTGILIRVWLKTAPLQQWAVGREYRLRVRRALAAHDITIGKPQWVSHNTVLQPALLNNEFTAASSNHKTNL